MDFSNLHPVERLAVMLLAKTSEPEFWIQKEFTDDGSATGWSLLSDIHIVKRPTPKFNTRFGRKCRSSQSFAVFIKLRSEP